MASEEQYLDELLKSMNNSAPKERSMDEVLREMGVKEDVPAPQEETPVMTEEIPVMEEVPVMEEDIPAVEEVPVMTEEIPVMEEVSSVPEGNSAVSEVSQELLADMLDELDDNIVPEAIFKEEDLIEPEVLEEPALEEPAAEEFMTSDALADLLDVLDTADFKAESTDVVEEIANDEAVVNFEETPNENDIIPGIDPELAALLDSMPSDEPLSEETSVVEEPVLEEAPVVEEEPVLEETPVIEEEPVLEEVPVVEEEPILEEAPVVEEEPILEEVPVVEEEPVIEEEPVLEEAPVVEEEPVLEETPAPVEEQEKEIPVNRPMPSIFDDDSKVDFTEDDLAAMFAEVAGTEISPEFSAYSPSTKSTSEPEAISEASAETDNSPEPEINDLDASLEALVNEIEDNEPEAIENTADESSEDEISEEDSESTNEAPDLGELDALLASYEESEENDNSSIDEDINSALEETSLEETAPFEADANPDDNNGTDVLSMLDNLGDSDEDLLALLEGIDDNAGSEEDDNAEEINALLSSDEDNSSKKKKKAKKEKKPKKEKKSKKEKNEEVEEGSENEEIKEKKPLFGGLFSKKKKANAESEEEAFNNDISLDNFNMDDALNDIEVSDDALLAGSSDDMDMSDMDELLSGIADSGEENIEFEAMDGDISLEDIRDVSEDDNKKKKGKKKKAKKEKAPKEAKEPGFFAKLINILTEEIDDEESDGKPIEELSNEDIIAEVDAENAIPDKKSKKAKKAKKGKKDKNKAEGAAEGEEAAEASDDKKKKKKKEKKPKEPKEPKVKEPSKKVLSKKAFIGLVAFCVTLVAAAVILSTVLPEHAEIKAAREAYYMADYETVYENLHNKKLSASDSLLFNRAKTVLTMQRRMDGYKNRIAMGDEVGAVDSLLDGVFTYERIRPNCDSSVIADIDAIYNNILSILDNTYGLSYEDCQYIYMQNTDDYTRIIYDLVHNGTWYKVGEEPVAEEPVNTIETDNSVDNSIENDYIDLDAIESNSNSMLGGLDGALPEEEDLNV